MRLPAKLLESIFVVFLLLFSFYLALFPLEASHYWDESVYLQHAEIFRDGRTNYSELDSRPPFLSFLISLGYLFWHNMYMAQIVVAFINSLGVIALYFLAKRMVNWRVGVISSFAMSTSPFVMEHAHYILSDVPSLSILTISVLFFYKAIDADEKRSTYLFISGLIFGLSILTRFTSLFFFLFFMASFYIHREKFIPVNAGNRVRILSYKAYKTVCPIAGNFILGMLFALLPYFIFAQINYGLFLYPFIKAQVIISASSPEPFLYYIHHFSNIFGAPITIGLFLGVLFLLGSLHKNTKTSGKTDSADKELFLLLLFFFAFFAYFSTMSHKEERYLIPLFFAAYILSGYGMASLASLFSKSKRINAFCSLVVVLLLFAANFSALSEHFRKPLINDAKTETVIVSEFLRNETQTNARIYAVLNYPVIAYYSGKETHAILPGADKLVCSDSSLKKYGIDKNSYLIFFPKIDTFERTFIEYSSFENCVLADKVNEISGVIIYYLK